MGSMITPMQGTVQANARLNIRKGLPSTSAPISSKAETGAELSVEGITEGEIVRGNAQWFAGAGGTYFWAGACGAFRPRTAGTSTPLPVHRRSNGTIEPLTDRDIRATFGDLTTAELAGGRVKIDPPWEVDNIVDLNTPVLAELGFARIKVHKKAAPRFQAAFESIASGGLADRLLTCGGTFVPRHKGWDPTRTLSSHSWGIAIDLNVAWNGYGSLPAPVGAKGSVRELVSIFESNGFAWGGYFEPKTICDGMHFELAIVGL